MTLTIKHGESTLEVKREESGHVWLCLVHEAGSRLIYLTPEEAKRVAGEMLGGTNESSN